MQNFDYDWQKLSSGGFIFIPEICYLVENAVENENRFLYL